MIYAPAPACMHLVQDMPQVCSCRVGITVCPNGNCWLAGRSALHHQHFCCTGPYSTYEGSPASKGQLSHDLWGVKAPSERWNWDGLRADIAKQGLRNSLLIAPMPTASTSQVPTQLQHSLSEGASNATCASVDLIATAMLPRRLVHTAHAILSYMLAARMLS